MFVCKLLVFVGICDIGVKYGLVLIEALDGTGILWYCTELFEVTLWVLFSRECMECCVLCVFVLDKIYCNRLVGIVCNGGLESVLELTILRGGFVCLMLMLKVVCIFESEVVYVCVYGCVVTDVLPGVEWDWNVNRGRVLVIRPLILLFEELGRWEVEKDVYVSDSGGGGGS